MAIGTQDLKFRVLAQVVGAQAFQGLQNQIENVGKSANFLTSTVKALGAALVAKQVVGYADGILVAADNLSKMSQKTGVAVETLSKFSGAAALSDVPLETLAKGLNRLSNNIVEASTGNAELASTFKNLGINIRDGNGNLKTAGDVTSELARKFANFKDGPEKAAITMKLLGKSGAEVVPFLNELGKSVEQVSVNIDTDFAKRAETFNDSLTTIGINLKNDTIKGLKNILPAIQELATAFIDLTSNSSGTQEFFTYLGEAARLTSQAAVVSFFALADVIDRTVTTVKEGRLELRALTFRDTDEDAAEYGRLKREFAQRVAERDAAEKKFLQATTKNSILFGQGSSDEIRKRQQSDTAPAKEKAKTTAPTVGDGVNSNVLRSFDEKIAKLRAEALTQDQSNATRSASVLIAELEAKGIAKSSKAYAEYSSKIVVATNALEAAKEKQAANTLIRKSQQETDLQRVSIENYALQSSELEKLTVAKQLDNQAQEATLRFTEEGKQAYLEATEAVKAQKLALIDQQQAQKQSYGAGAKQALREYLDAARDVASQTKAAFSQAFQNVEDSLVDFVKSGKLNFKKFADDIIDQMIRISIRSAALNTITGIGGLFGGGAASAGVGSAVASSGYDNALGTFQFAKGGVMTDRGPIPLNKYARGGVASSPQLALFGEAGAEAYVPLPDGRRIPVSMKGGGGGTSVQVVVNMGEGGGDSTNSDTDKGRQIGNLVAAAVKNEILNQKRPGGILA